MSEVQEQINQGELLALRGICKAYPGVQALNGVNFDVRVGEVHALVGENGAGKSTLIKIITGAQSLDEGEIIFKGKTLPRLTPRDARELGIGATYQEINLVRQLSVAENVFFGSLPTRGSGLLDWRKLYRDAKALLASLGLDIDPAQEVQDLSVGQQQIVEIVRAATLGHALIIMDEPTSSLSEREVELLFSLIERLKERGTAVIYVSHRLDEILRLADRVTVLRDGQYVGTLTRSQTSKEVIIGMMVGREISELYPKQEAVIRQPVLEVRHLVRRGVLDDVGFSLCAGEILGMFGLIGAGRTEVARTIFGLDRRDAGDIRLNGAAVNITTPQHAIRLGIGLVPEDRKSQGLVLPMTIRENVTLPQLRAMTQAGLMSPARERNLTRSMVARLDIRTPSIEQQAVNLSGGNQQKVVIAKWLALSPRVLIVDEPTRGIDVATKAQVHALLSELAQSGVGVLMISSELPEILGMSDRILVMYRGKIVGEFSRAEATPEAIMRCATGDSLVQAGQERVEAP